MPVLKLAKKGLITRMGRRYLTPTCDMTSRIWSSTGQLDKTSMIAMSVLSRDRENAVSYNILQRNGQHPLQTPGAWHTIKQRSISKFRFVTEVSGRSCFPVIHPSTQCAVSTQLLLHITTH